MEVNKINILTTMKPQFFETTAPVYSPEGQWMCVEALSICSLGETIFSGLDLFFKEVKKDETY